MTDKITALARINADLWEHEHVVEYSPLSTAMAYIAAQRAHDYGYEVVAESPGVFPNSKIIRYRKGSASRWVYLFATIEEIPAPYTGKTLAGALPHAKVAAEAIEEFIQALPGQRIKWNAPMGFGSLTLAAGGLKLDLLYWLEWAEREIAQNGDLDGSHEIPAEPAGVTAHRMVILEMARDRSTNFDTFEDCRVADRALGCHPEWNEHHGHWEHHDKCPVSVARDLLGPIYWEER